MNGEANVMTAATASVRVPGGGRVFINGDGQRPRSGGEVDVVGLASGERIPAVVTATGADIDDAVVAASAVMAWVRRTGWTPTARQIAPQDAKETDCLR